MNLVINKNNDILEPHGAYSKNVKLISVIQMPMYKKETSSEIISINTEFNKIQQGIDVMVFLKLDE